MRQVVHATIGLVLVVGMLSPALGLVSAVVERGAGESPRVEVFSLALTVFDPLVQESLRNSLLMAVGVSIGSMVLGLGLGRVGRRGGRAGRILEALAALSASIPPLLLSLGVLGWWHVATGSLMSAPGWVRGVGWVWVELVWGVGLVSVSARGAVGTDCSRLGRGRAAGGGTLLADLARFGPAGGVAGGYAIGDVGAGGALFEPTAPLLFGLRRTLASRLVEAALGPGSDPVARAPALVLLALGVSAVVRAVYLTWGGRRAEGLESETAVRPPCTRGSAIRAWLVLLAFGVLSLGPVVGLANVAWAGLSWDEGGSGFRSWLVLIEDVRPALVDSAILGASAATLSLVGASLACLRRSGSRLDRLSLGVAGRMPALALGVGGLGLVWILGGAEPIPGARDRGLAGWLDPYRSPGVLLILVVAIVQVPRLTQVLRARAAFSSPIQREAARLLSGPHGRWTRWRTIVWPSVGPPLLSAWVWTAVLAGFETAAALVLTPTSAFRPIGPVLIDLAGSAQGFSKACSLALMGWLVVVLVWLVSGRSVVSNGEETPSSGG